MTWKEATQTVNGVLSTELFNLGGKSVTLSTIITAAIIIVAAFVISYVVRKAIARALRRKGVRGPSGARVIGRLLHYAFVVVGVGVALDTAGIELGTLFATGAVFAVGIGFAMQDIAKNFVSGVTLLVERTIRPGDILEVEKRVVRVISMGGRTTIVRTLDDEQLIIPNATLVQSTVKNYTLSDPVYRIRVVIGVTYDSDMRLVRKTLENVANDIEGRHTEKEPRVLLVEFGSSSVDWEISIWIDDPWNAKPAKSRIREAVWWALKEHGIVIAFPQLDVHFDPPIVNSFERLAKAA